MGIKFSSTEMTDILKSEGVTCFVFLYLLSLYASDPIGITLLTRKYVENTNWNRAVYFSI